MRSHPDAIYRHHIWVAHCYVRARRMSKLKNYRGMRYFVHSDSIQHSLFSDEVPSPRPKDNPNRRDQ